MVYTIIRWIVKNVLKEKSTATELIIGERSLKSDLQTNDSAFQTRWLSYSLWFLAPLPRKWLLIPSGCVSASGNCAGYLGFGFVPLACLSGSVFCLNYFKYPRAGWRITSYDRDNGSLRLVCLATQPSMDLSKTAADFPLGDVCLGLTATSGSKKKPSKDSHHHVNRFHKHKCCFVFCDWLPVTAGRRNKEVWCEKSCDRKTSVNWEVMKLQSEREREREFIGCSCKQFMARLQPPDCQTAVARPQMTHWDLKPAVCLSVCRPPDRQSFLPLWQEFYF